MNITQPKVFISYSWERADTVTQVEELAKRLVNDGVDVVLDIWELLDGQDKYAFMERSVTDTTITKVLMICDKSYAEKANARVGGVGDETMVISPEVYEKATETKYIPIIFERDEEGKEYVPAYLKPRIYIDLSSDERFEASYEKLLRNLHNKPEHSKPPLGKMPEWLNEEAVSLTPLRATIKQLQAFDGKNKAKQEYLVRNANDELIKSLIELSPNIDDDFANNLLKQLDVSKPLRDLFLDYVELLVANDYNVSTLLGEQFEHMFNDTLNPSGKNSYSQHESEFISFFLWETFICTTAILLHFERFSDLHSLLARTYFLRESWHSKTVKAYNFVVFREPLRTIEEICKPKSKNPRLYTLAGDIVVNREKKPLITQTSLANADLVLSQLSRVFDMTRDNSGLHWFPNLYCYYEGLQNIWVKLISKAYCQKIFPLFGVSSTGALRESVKKCVFDRETGYRNAFNPAPVILNSIELDKIATLP